VPTPITHMVAGIAVATTVRPHPTPRRFWLLAAFCAAIPDIDIIWSPYGISTDDMWGHRGITHSIPVAIVIAGLAARVGFAGTQWRGFRLRFWLAFALAGVSHGLLDSLTQFAGWVALFAPFTAQRFYIPFQVVSWYGPPFRTDSVGALVRMMGAEVVDIWLPSLVIFATALAWQRRSRATAR
jgi:inner membrane protein